MELPNDVVERFAHNEPQPRSKGRKNHPWPDHVPNRTQGENPRAINLTRQSLEKSGLVEDHHIVPSHIEPTNKETNMNNETSAAAQYSDTDAQQAARPTVPMAQMKRIVGEEERADFEKRVREELEAIEAGQSSVASTNGSQTTWYDPATWSTGAQMIGGVAAGALIGVALYKIFED